MRNKDITTIKPVICVVGPTASGKTSLSQQLALRLNGEVVSADSMQVYKGLDIGTGKIPTNQMLVKHYGIDICNLSNPYSAALFQPYARKCFLDIDARSKRSILCGGTGLYIRSAIDDYSFVDGDQVENPTRQKYTQILENIGNQALWDMLNSKDPQSASLIHPNNSRRVIRAFELLQENTSYAIQFNNLQTLQQKVPAIFIGLQVDPLLLANRISDRVDNMFDCGLVAEVKHLLDSGFRDAITAPQAIGYKEIVACLDNGISLDVARTNIKVASRRYAKRQRTWFRKDKRIAWIDANNLEMQHLLEQIAKTKLIPEIV